MFPVRFPSGIDRRAVLVLSCVPAADMIRARAGNYRYNVART